MRSVVRFVAYAASALWLAGCGPLDSTYIREGIGTNLSTPELPEVTNLQDLYIGEICRQAGLRVSQQDGSLYCDEVGMRPGEWATFVQAGMNDIDRRCDAYLAWIDNKKRWREPFLAQLHTTAATTAAIMGLGGAGPKSIAVVAAAFGFAQDTFLNFYSRLITEVNHSVIQSVVLDNQNQFRVKTAEVRIDNRPAAIYLLRNYLRICTPFSIEMSINNTVTVFHRGGAEALTAPPLLTRAPMVARVAANSVGARISAIRPPPITPPPAEIIGGAIGPVEKTISLNSGKAFQRALCVDDTGVFDAVTRTALRDFKAAHLYPRDSAATDSIATDADLRRLRDAQRRFPSCRDAGFRNGYEVGLFSRFSAAKMREDLSLALSAAGLAVPAGLIAPNAQPADNGVRQAIASLRTKYGLPGEPVFDRAFYDTMLNNLAR